MGKIPNHIYNKKLDILDQAIGMELERTYKKNKYNNNENKKIRLGLRLARRLLRSLKEVVFND